MGAVILSLLTYNFESPSLRNNHEITVLLPDKPWGMAPREFYGNEKRYADAAMLKMHDP